MPILHQKHSASSVNSCSLDSGSTVTALKRHFLGIKEKLLFGKSIVNNTLEQEKNNNLPETSLKVMEVVSQLPVNILNHVEKVDLLDATEKLSDNRSLENSAILKHTESENPSKPIFETIVAPQLSAISLSNAENASNNKLESENVEQKVPETVHAIDNPQNSSNLQSEILVRNSSSVLSEKENHLEKSQASELLENKLNSCVDNNESLASYTEDYKIILNDEKLTEVNETPLENITALETVANNPVKKSISDEICHVEPQQSKSNENISDSCIVKKPRLQANDTEINKMNPEEKKLPEIGETRFENLVTLESAQEKQSFSKDNLISDENKIELQSVNRNITIDEKAPNHREDSKGTAVEKRKLEFKSKVSKKRKNTHEKQVQYNARSIKKAAEISYSEDDFKLMINLMKGFL